MANLVPDGTYTIGLPFGRGSITNPGEGRYVNILPHGSLGEDADKIKVVYKPERAAYSLQFEKEKKYLTWADEVIHMNTKLIIGDKPRYVKISRHEYEVDKFVITPAEDNNFHVGLALERIFPPWAALSNFPEKQAWAIEKV